MSYLVLARKWRPKTFTDLIGQEHIVNSLHNAILSEKIAHAYLFSGPRGVGKTSTARILASALNCDYGITTKPCMRCNNCASIANGSSVDVLEIDGASNNSVDNIRELRETVKYAPSVGRYKVYIIDEIHMLSDAAFNALLKTLEEPPPHCIFIFATTAPKKIPATILSRCQHFIFKRVAKNAIKDHLAALASRENITVTPKALDMLAQSADGSMRDSLTLLDQASSLSDSVDEAQIQKLLGLPESEIIFNIAEAVITGNVNKSIQIIHDMATRGYDLRHLSRELVEYFRNIAIVKAVDKPELILELSKLEVEIYQTLAQLVTIEEITALLAELFKIDTEVRMATSPRYVLELGLIRISFIKGMASIGQILKQFEDPSLTTAYQGQPTFSPIAQPTTKSSLPPSTLQPQASPRLASVSDTDSRIGQDEVKKQVLRKIEEKNAWLSWNLNKAGMIITAHEAKIILNGGIALFSDTINKNAQLIKEAIKEVTGASVKITLDSTESNEDGLKKKDDIRTSVQANPVIKSVIEEFQGRIVDIKPLNE
jgi:DNA polymerase-3 subunit gamma/tau